LKLILYTKRNINLGKKDIFSILIRIVSAFSVLVSNVIVSRLFTSKELSMYYLLMPFTTFFSMIFVSPISIFQINRSLDRNENIYEISLEYLIILLSLSLVFIIFILTLNQEINLKVIFSIYLFFELTIGTLVGIIIQNESFYGKVTKSAIISFLVSSTSVIFPLIMGYNYSWNLNSWLLGLMFSRFSHILIIIYILYPFISSSSLSTRLKLFLFDIFNNWFSIVKLALNSVISWFHQNSAKFIFTAFLGLSYSSPYLYIISISSTMASVLEGIFKPILDRNIFLSINKTGERVVKPELLYLIIGLMGFIFLPIISNIISNYRYEKFMNLSRVIFIFEVAKLFMYYKLSVFQIKFGYNKTVLTNVMFLLVYLILTFAFLYFSDGVYSFYILFISLSLFIFYLIKKIPNV
jgi:hypothetical protein